MFFPAPSRWIARRLLRARSDAGLERRRVHDLAVRVDAVLLVALVWTALKLGLVAVRAVSVALGHSADWTRGPVPQLVMLTTGILVGILLPDEMADDGSE